jgi:hypothetical protein
VGKHNSDKQLRSLLNPYSNTVSIGHGTGRLLVDMTKFFDTITEVFERLDMANVPLGLTDIADSDTWFSLIYNGWAEALCQHMAVTVADVIHRRYPAAAGMPLDERFDRCAASLNPPYEWSYPGEHLELAKQVLSDHLRGQPKDSYDIGADYNQSSPIDPLYKTVKSTFELAVAVIGVAKTHPLYQTDNP